MESTKPAAGGVSPRSQPSDAPGLSVSPKLNVVSNAAKDAGGSTTSDRTNGSIGSSDRKSSTNSDTAVAVENAGSRKNSDACLSTANGEALRRHSSVSSVTIQLPRNPALPQGNQKRMNKKRLRNASPEPER